MLPDRILYINPLIKVLQKAGGRMDRTLIHEAVANELNLSDEVRYAELDTGHSKFEMELNFTRYYLKVGQYLDTSVAGIWSLSAKGFLSDKFTDEELKDLQKKIDK